MTWFQLQIIMTPVLGRPRDTPSQDWFGEFEFMIDVQRERTRERRPRTMCSCENQHMKCVSKEYKHARLLDVNDKNGIFFQKMRGNCKRYSYFHRHLQTSNYSKPNITHSDENNEKKAQEYIFLESASYSATQNTPIVICF